MRPAAFNHFAQDANFNRGAYRALEDRWAKAKRAGKRVTVGIVSFYTGSSQRPERIGVSFTIDGQHLKREFVNAPGGGHHVKN